jgi:hypothetical protein
MAGVIKVDGTGLEGEPIVVGSPGAFAIFGEDESIEVGPIRWRDVRQGEWKVSQVENGEFVFIKNAIRGQSQVCIQFKRMVKNQELLLFVHRFVFLSDKV